MDILNICIRRMYVRHRARSGRLIRLSLLVVTFFIGYVFFHNLSSQENIKVIQPLRMITQAHNRSDRSEKCTRLRLDLWHPSLKSFFQDPPAPNCDRHENNWIETRNGRLYIKPEAENLHGKVTCQQQPLFRGNNDSEVNWGELVNIASGIKLTSDFFKVVCQGLDGSNYSLIHSSIAKNNVAVRRSTENIHLAKRRSLAGLNILIFGFDSLSRLTWMRNLPKTHEFFTDDLGGIVLEGYNIVGDGTPAALLPILTGKTELELPEVRRGFPNASYVDVFPWIWKDLEKIGYVTQFGEDAPDMGTFTYRMLGFHEQPTDHYLRTVYLERKQVLCYGSTPDHVTVLDWIHHFFKVYHSQPKFSFVFHGGLSHNDISLVRLADADLQKFLQALQDKGHLDNTLLILMADHGARFGQLRAVEQGKLEERNPYMGIRIPPWLNQQHPNILQNLKLNADRLTTPFDIHATFQHIINFKGGRKRVGDVRRRGISLFEEIPENRTCSDAAVDAHWCACLEWNPVAVDDEDTQRAALEVVKYLNQITAEHRELCAELVLDHIISSSTYLPNQDLLRFKQSADGDGQKPDMSDDQVATDFVYQLTLTVRPSGGTYEATVKCVRHIVTGGWWFWTYHDYKSQFSVNEKEISRTDQYGKQPHCIMDRLPHLRQFCYCKLQ